MPKLRYKENEKEKKHKHRSGSSSSRKREDYYKPPHLYEEEAGWVPPRPPFDEEREWRARLFENMMQDEGQDPFYSQYEPPPTTHTMTDEEHRQYMVDGMYKRTHKDEIAAKKKRNEEKKKRKREQEEARKEQERRHQEQIRLENIRKQMEQVKNRESSRAEYSEKWSKLENLPVVHKKDIPWPILGKSFSLDAVRSFVVDPQVSASENKKNVRKEQTRYHPDKFITRYMKRFEGSEKERKRVIVHINEISGWLNEIWSQVNV